MRKPEQSARRCNLHRRQPRHGRATWLGGVHLFRCRPPYTIRRRLVGTSRKLTGWTGLWGHHRSLCAGRELDDLLRVLPRVDLFDMVVAENGAVLYRPATKEERLLAPPPPPEFAERLRAALAELETSPRNVVAVGDAECARLSVFFSDWGPRPMAEFCCKRRIGSRRGKNSPGVLMGGWHSDGAGWIVQGAALRVRGDHVRVVVFGCGLPPSRDPFRRWGP